MNYESADEEEKKCLPQHCLMHLPSKHAYCFSNFRQQLAEVTAERDLFRSQWLQMKHEMAQVMRMTPEECEELLKTGVDGQVVLAEMEEMLK